MNSRTLDGQRHTRSVKHTLCHLEHPVPVIDELSRVPRQEKESVVRVPATSIVTEKARLEWEIVVPARVVRTRSPPFDVARFGCCARERHERALIVTLKLTDAWECPLRRSLCEFVLRIRRIPQLTARTAADGNLSQRRPELSLEGVSKKSKDFLFGRTTQNTVVVFPKENIQIGDFINVEISECTSATLIGKKC